MTKRKALPSSKDALDWMNDQKSKEQLTLFRGQTQIWKSVLPSLMRPNVSDEDREKWQDTTVRFVSASQQVTGASVGGPHHALGLVQHYLGKSTVIDVTGSPDVALYFALKGRRKNRQVVYSIDAEVAIERERVVTNHDNLILPIELGGLRHRWMRQDGFTIGVENWSDPEAYAKFNFLDLQPNKFEFEALPTDDADFVEPFIDLEPLHDDPLVSRVRAVFEEQSRILGKDHEKVVRRMLAGSLTVDTKTELERKIIDLIDCAKEKQFPKPDITEIKKLLEASKRSKWDTSSKASLDYWKKRLGL